MNFTNFPPKWIAYLEGKISSMIYQKLHLSSSNFFKPLQCSYCMEGFQLISLKNMQHECLIMNTVPNG